MFKVLAFALVFYFGVMLSSHLLNSDGVTYEKAKVLVFPPQYLQQFSFGFSDNISDSLWLRWIQDLGTCGKEREVKDKSQWEFKKKTLKETQQLGSSKELNRRSDKEIFTQVIEFSGKKDLCQKGWSFKMLDMITTLSARFRMPYFAGATSLSVITEDPVGAKIIYEKGLRQFPNDWNLHYRAAYHYLYELKDFEKAAYLLDRAGDLGAPKWVKSLASRLYTSSGQAFLGLITLKAYLKEVMHPKRKMDVQNRIQELQKILDKEKSKKK